MQDISADALELREATEGRCGPVQLTATRLMIASMSVLQHNGHT